MVVATQNPIEMDGTYPLPEAQRDRFTARVSVGYPDLGRRAGHGRRARRRPTRWTRCARSPTPGRSRAVIEAVRRVHVGPEVRQYCVELVGATRRLPGAAAGRLAAGHPAAGARGPGAGRAVRARLRRARRRPGRRRAGAGAPAAAHPGRARGPALGRRHRPRPGRPPAGAGPGPTRLPSVRATGRPVSRARPVRPDAPGAAACSPAAPATAVCAVVLDERDLLRIGAFVALLPLLALLLAARARRDRCGSTASSSPPGVPVDGVGDGRLRLPGGPLLGDAAAGSTRCRTPPGRSARTPAAVHGAPGSPRRDGACCHYPLRPALRGVHRDRSAARSAPPTRSGSPSSSTSSPRPTGCSCCPGWSRCAGCPRRSGAGEGTAGCRARAPGPGRLRRAGPPVPVRRRAAPGALAQHGPARRADGAAGGAAVARRASRCCSTAGTRAHRGHGAGASLEFAISLAASIVRAPARPRRTRSRCVTEDGVELTGRARPAAPTPLLDALAALRPSARADLTGPAVRTGTDLLAVLGAVGPGELDAPAGPAAGGGHAVLLDTATWDRGGRSGRRGPPAATVRRDRLARHRGGPPARRPTGRGTTLTAGAAPDAAVSGRRRRSAGRGDRSGRRAARRPSPAPRTDWPGARTVAPRRRRPPAPPASPTRRCGHRGIASRGWPCCWRRAGHGGGAAARAGSATRSPRSSRWSRSGCCCTAGRRRSSSPPASAVAVLVLLTAVFTDDGVLGVLPGPRRRRPARRADRRGGPADRATGIAPVPATPEILVLVTAAFGLLAVAVHLAAVRAGRPGRGRACPCWPCSPCRPRWPTSCCPGGRWSARRRVRAAAADRRRPARPALLPAAGGGRAGRGRGRAGPRARAPAAAFVGTAGRFDRRLGGRSRRLDRAQPVHRAARAARPTRAGRAVRGARPRPGRPTCAR